MRWSRVNQQLFQPRSHAEPAWGRGVVQEKLRQASGRVDDGCRRAEEETAARRELTEELERARAKASEFGGAQLQAAEEIRQAAAEQVRAG